ncbi:MAG: hypothetical protein H7X80_02530, partial [bacterium]|nr:hypothetical protein [Candidatus Kapabacteria bacterium]
RQTAVWVKRKNEPAPPLEEPEVIDIPEPIDSVVTTPTNPDDGFHVPPDTATVPSDNNPNPNVPVFPRDRTPNTTPPINSNGTSAQPRRLPNGR